MTNYAIGIILCRGVTMFAKAIMINDDDNVNYVAVHGLHVDYDISPSTGRLGSRFDNIILQRSIQIGYWGLYPVKLVYVECYSNSTNKKSALVPLMAWSLYNSHNHFCISLFFVVPKNTVLLKISVFHTFLRNTVFFRFSYRAQSKLEISFFLTT